jgi:putative transposase
VHRESAPVREFHPPHIYERNTCYFITASIVDHRMWLDTDIKRCLLRDVLKQSVDVCEIHLYAWVILSNHYHLLLRTGDAIPVHRFIKRLHGHSAIDLNKLDTTPGRKVWYQYWDRCPRNEEEFWAYFNYVHVNPIKHGYVNPAYNEFEKAQDRTPIGPDDALGILQYLQSYPYSSFHYYLRMYGAEFLTDALVSHPLPDYSESDIVWYPQQVEDSGRV